MQLVTFSHFAAPTTAGAAGQAPEVDLPCLLGSCSELAAACAADAGCQAIQACIQACAGDAACNNACFFKLADEPYAELAVCAVDAGCIAGPPAIGNATCPDLAGAALAAGFNASWLADAGTMYVAGGGNAVYDCFDCQVGALTARWAGTAGGLSWTATSAGARRTLLPSYQSHCAASLLFVGSCGQACPLSSLGPLAVRLPHSCWSLRRPPGVLWT